MKINPMSFFVASNINKTNNHSALKNNDINDSFVSTTSFAGKRKFMTDRDLKYSSAHVKSPWNYLNIDLKTGRIDNFWARKMTEGLLPGVNDLFRNYMVEEGKSLFDVIVERGDDLQNVPKDNVQYINNTFKSGELALYTPPETAYILLSRNDKNKGADIKRYLEEKKTLIPREEYDQLLMDVITGKKEHSFDIVHEKVMIPTYAEKMERVKDVFTEKSNKTAIEKNTKYLNELGSRKSVIADFSDEEFAFFLTTDMDKIEAKNVNSRMPVFQRTLSRLKEYLPDGVYQQFLTEAAKGERCPNQIIDLLKKSPAKNVPFNKFDNVKWTEYILKSTEQ